MGNSSSSEELPPLIIDSSVVINLNSSGIGPKLLATLGRTVMVSEVVIGELNGSRAALRRDHDALKSWLATGCLTELPLQGKAAEIFESLISGDTFDTLDDGEAATIAHALELPATAVIDERKAGRICRQRFPHLETVSTADLMLNPMVVDTFGAPAVGDALFAALSGARMRVPPERVLEVVHMIGSERASLCHCLPNSARTRKIAAG